MKTTNGVNYKEEIKALIANPEFQKLKTIGGHKVYHLEGNAYKHTMMVAKEAGEMFGRFSFMHYIAFLHDIGKIYTSVCNGPDDWSYPHHSDGGALRLNRFIPFENENYITIQWYIFNHIKPLFFKGTRQECMESIRGYAPFNDYMFNNLIKLVICDIKGSVSVNPQTAKINYLNSLLK